MQERKARSILELYTLSVRGGESGNMYSGRILVFSLHIIPGKKNTKHGVGNHDEAFSGRHYTITACWLSGAVHTFFLANRHEALKELYSFNKKTYILTGNHALG